MSQNKKRTEAENADEQAGAEALEAHALSPEQIEDLKSRAAKAEENWDRLVRTTADFENYKKRAQRDREDAVKYANESLVKKLVPVLDSFEMALSAANLNQGEALQSLQAGVTMVAQQLKKALLESGLEEVDATGKPFDPNLHEAISQQETTEVPEGQVVQQVRKGYKLRERLVRPASVIVAKKPES